MIVLKDLLSKAMQRAKVSTQVSAAQVVSLASQCLDSVMQDHRPDARVVSYHDQILLIETLHASTSQFLFEREEDLLQQMQERLPAQKIRKIRYKIVHHFKGSEL